MDKKELFKNLAFLASIDNIYKSGISAEKVLIVKSFFLLMRKLSLLAKIESNLKKDNIKISIQNCIENCDNQNIKDLYFDYLQSLINSVRVKYLGLLNKAYLNFSDGYIEENAGDIFDSDFRKYTISNKSLPIDALQPKELTELINQFCEYSSVKDYYNPFAGLASQALNLPKQISYIGEELDEDIWLLGKIKMLLCNCPDSFKYSQANSFKNWASTSQKYDFIGFNPPLNLKLSKSDINDLNSEYAYLGNANSLILSECFEQLRDDGKMVMVVSRGFLFSGHKKDKKLKKELVDNGHIEKIIALPERLFNFTSIAVNLIVLSKSSRDKKMIEFIDASDKFTTSDSKTNILDNREIFYLLRTETDDLKKLVNIKEVSKNEYNLSVNRYVFEDLDLSFFEKDNLIPLRELISPIRSKSYKPEKAVKVVRVRDMANNSIHGIKSFDEVELTIPKYRVNLLEDNSLLLATTWKSLKPTYCKKDNEDIYYNSSSILAFKVDETKVDISYLILELNKDYVKKQLEQKSIGTDIYRINKKDLLEVQVVVPDFQSQEKRKTEFKEAIIDNFQNQLEELKDRLGVDVADENSFLRHKISGTLKNIRGSFSKLKSIIDNQVQKDLPEIYEYKIDPMLKTTLKDYLHRLDRDIKSVRKAVKNVGVDLTSDDVKLEILNFIEFIKGYVEEVKNRPNNNFKINIDIDKEALRDNKIKEISFRGDKELLYQVFDNIIENAERHAFEDNKKNRINVDLIYNFESLEVQLDFTNTGKTLPEDYTFEAFTRKGSTAGKNAGNGIGGWFMNEVMKLHNGSFGFTDETGPEGIFVEDLATTIELTFPIEIKI